MNQHSHNRRDAEWLGGSRIDSQREGEMMASIEAEQSVYPLRPRPIVDPRFEPGLLLDVHDVLERHGYPRPSSNLDHARILSALFQMIYGDGEDRDDEHGADPAAHPGGAR